MHGVLGHVLQRGAVALRRARRGGSRDEALAGRPADAHGARAPELSGALGRPEVGAVLWRRRHRGAGQGDAGLLNQAALQQWLLDVALVEGYAAEAGGGGGACRAQSGLAGCKPAALLRAMICN